MLAFESLFARDLNLLLGIFMLSSILVIVVNLIVDIIYCFLDPRIEVSDMSTFWQRYRRNKSAVFGLGVILLVIIMAVTANFLYPFDPFRLAGKPLSGPGMNGFLLGSDSLGRDVAAGIVHGAKTSLLIGLIATLVAVLIGIVFGAFSGYYGGRLDDFLMRVTEIFQTIPSFIFAILLVAIMKPSIVSIVIAIAVVSWPGVARLVRGEFLALKSREFVQACHTLGMSDLRIMLREILPTA